MGVNLGNAVAAIPEVHTRTCIARLAKAMDETTDGLAVVVRKSSSAFSGVVTVQTSATPTYSILTFLDGLLVDVT